MIPHIWLASPERPHQSLKVWKFLSKKERRKFVVFSYCGVIRKSAAPIFAAPPRRSHGVRANLYPAASPLSEKMCYFLFQDNA
jgi:hypothetical protein